MIGVDKGDAQPVREATADCGFPHAHQPHQDDRSGLTRIRQISFAVHREGAIHSGSPWGKAVPAILGVGEFMSRLIKWLVLVAVLVGAMFYLAGRVSEKALTRHEKAVSVDALNK